jgi:hypothetical protein
MVEADLDDLARRKQFNCHSEKSGRV